MFPGIYFILGLVVFLVLIFWVIPKFYKRKVESIFMKPGSADVFIQTNARSFTPTKTGMIENNRIFLNKVNLDTGKIIFTNKIKSFSSKMLSGFSRIAGINDTHTFIVVSGDKLIIIENQTGKIVATQKDLIKKFPHLKGFKTDTIQFDAEEETVIIFNLAGYAFALHAADISLKNLNRQVITKSTKPHYQELNSYFMAKLAIPDQHPITSYPYNHFPNAENTIYFHAKQGTQRHFVFYGKPTNEPVINDSLHNFLSPQVISSGIENNKTCWGENFLILHFSIQQNDIKNILISLVSPQSKAIWTHPINDLLPGVNANSNSCLFFEHIANVTYSINFEKNNHSHKIFSCQINQEKGKVQESVTKFAL
ncbi:MAG: hypothetical protein IPM74_03180 [Crocinitomicaceae bacterium]|nr:hypothetical protein [Crocinitomicaceae bacterium]MBK8924919.1 hypothetical protein [Crocinitomicaceae bacterium]